MKNAIRSLEGGRGIAALVVALYHLGIGMQFSVIRNGYLFVDLFFVLSGFVICAAYAGRLNDGGDMSAFVVRRIGRLLPLLVFSTLFFVLVQNGVVLAKRIALDHGHAALLHSPGAIDYAIPTAGEVLSTLTMTHGLNVFDHLILNTPSWSISTEFYTYILFGLVCLLTSRALRVPVYIAIAAIGLAICAWASVNLHGCLRDGGCLSLTYDFGYPRSVFSFFLGALTCLASRRARLPVATLQILGVAALILLFSFADAVPVIAFGFPFAFALLILSTCQDRGPLAEALKARPFQVLGTRSYSIYLLHMPLVLIFGNFARRATSIPASLLVVTAFVATLVILSGWTYRFIEDPFRNRFNRLAANLNVAPARVA
jgi:peptidoglycan/LPS O-acetylase OafA/YrhL